MFVNHTQTKEYTECNSKGKEDGLQFTTQMLFFKTIRGASKWSYSLLYLIMQKLNIMSSLDWFETRSESAEISAQVSQTGLKFQLELFH